MEEKQQKLFFLIELAKKSNLNNPWLINALRTLQVRWSERLYAAAFSLIVSKVDLESLVYGRFTLPISQSEMPGELGLGQVIDVPQVRFQFPISALPMHIFVAGSSGFGKSTYALKLAEEVHRAGIRHIRIVDPKADDYFALAKKYPEFLLLKWSDLRFNFLTPPPNVPRNEWLQTIVGHLAQTFNFWQGSEALLFRHLAESPADITLPELIFSIKSKKRIHSQKDAFVISTVISRLEMLNDLFGEVISTDSNMLERL